MLERISLEDGGGSNLNNLWSGLISASHKIFTQKVLLLYDCDVDKAPSQNDNLRRNKIPYQQRKYIQKGVENLFPDSLIELSMKAKDAFIDITPPSKIRGEVRGETKYKVNPDEKRNLCNWICENAQTNDFRDFEVVFKIIEESI